MAKKVNVNSFNDFITEHGNVSVKMANVYANIGDTIIRIAMQSTSTNMFESEMAKLMDANKELITDGRHCVSNLASCLLYAQSRDNFNLGQGFGKGSNINQYGVDPETSHQTVLNLMTYFSTEREGKEYGYDAASTHGKWRRKPLPEQIPNLKLRIDIDSNPKTGSIPAPLKGIHTAHFVPGVDDSGTVKLLIKPEDWGMKKFLHIIMHTIDYIITRFTSQNIDGLEGRQETKQTKEHLVKEVKEYLEGNFKVCQAEIQDSSLKLLFNNISKRLVQLSGQKGFDEPMTFLEETKALIRLWLDDNPKHAKRNEVLPLVSLIDDRIKLLGTTKQMKYASEFQTFSEVRLCYDNEGAHIDTQEQIANDVTEDSSYSILDYRRDIQKLVAMLNSLGQSQDNISYALEASSILEKIKECDARYIASRGLDINGQVLFSRHGECDSFKDKHFGLNPNTSVSGNAMMHMENTREFTRAMLLDPSNPPRIAVSPMVRAKQTASKVIPIGIKANLSVEAALSENSDAPSGSNITSVENFKTQVSNLSFWKSPKQYCLFNSSLQSYGNEGTFDKIKESLSVADKALIEHQNNPEQSVSSYNLAAISNAEKLEKTRQLIADGIQNGKDTWLFGHGKNFKAFLTTLFGKSKNFEYGETRRVYMASGVDGEKIYTPPYNLVINQNTGKLRANYTPMESTFAQADDLKKLSENDSAMSMVR